MTKKLALKIRLRYVLMLLIKKSTALVSHPYFSAALNETSIYVERNSILS